MAGRYASALFDLAEEQNALDAVAEDLGSMQQMLHESEDLRRLVRSPVLSRDDQWRALQALCERAGFNDLTRRFLGLLAQKRRLFTLADVSRAYAAMLAEHRGETSAEVVSATPLSDAQLAAVREQVASIAAGRSVNLTTAVDPDLLGGLIVRVGSRMIDASLRSKLHQLELAMKGAA